MNIVPYSLMDVRGRADPSLWSVSPQVMLYRVAGLALLSIWLAATFLASEYHCMKLKGKVKSAMASRVSHSRQHKEAALISDPSPPPK